MISTEQIFDATIGEHPIDPHVLAAGIDALQACIVACEVCADSDLDAVDPGTLVECVRRNHDCIEACRATVGIAARWRRDSHALATRTLEACVVACRLCADECARHDHDHCRECAQSCRRCESACHALLEETGHELSEGV